MSLNFAVILYFIEDLSDNEKENKFNTTVRNYISKRLKTNKGELYDIKNSYFFDKMMPK